jgi:spore germination protein GerM
MENQKQSRRVPLGLIAGIAIAILAIGGGAAWLAKQTLLTKTPTPSVPETVKPQQPPESPTQQEQVQVYWISATSRKIEAAPATISVAKSTDRTKVLESIFQILLNGPNSEQNSGQLTTTIPQGTKLLSLSTDEKGIHVNLSKEFTSGGGSTAMIGRVAQVLYTATSLDNNAKVWINVEGKPIEQPLGGEGLILEQPTTRHDFKNNFAL